MSGTDLMRTLPFGVGLCLACGPATEVASEGPGESGSSTAADAAAHNGSCQRAPVMR